MLKVVGLHGGYGDLEVLFGVDFEVGEGKIVALLGANGAGKTTTLKTISGLISLTQGSVTFAGTDISKWPPRKIVAAGLIQVAEGRRLFADMTVRENLLLGTYRRGRSRTAESRTQVLTMFPRLEERLEQSAGTLSGGEQQMLAIGRALMSQPRLLMLDEPSLGLAPNLVAEIFQVVRRIADEGTTVLLVEQNAVQALQLADQAFVLEHGEVVLSGTGDELLGDERVKTAYLGM